ncbi:aspartate aminotransferase family protein [Nocardioides sp. GY 10127]|uniref:aspartate aminotransferase family protein n=1 Tax=Nocardioides sp. GY 10127 TaxID=2569762 RepID=UPI0010A755F6|nr:aspartate aminotransferase family protein [Nocardioides sp. GY 10127]TIC79318.1 aspartate aminotransferase family protein [Nocardioides sp. GY 10127]
MSQVLPPHTGSKQAGSEQAASEKAASKQGSSILDANAGGTDLEALGPRSRDVARRRGDVLGSGYRLFYSTPLHLVRGEGCRVWDLDGRRYLDLYNNVPGLGHAHPAVTQAVTRQLGTLNTHTRYLHEGIVGYAEDLLSTMPAEIDRAVFVCTGSEANDLAARVARRATGRRGIIVTSEAYHGNTELVSGLSPALGGGQPLGADVRIVPPPDPALAAAVGQRDVGAWFADHVRRATQQLQASGAGVAALLVDTVFSSDGVFPGEPGTLDAAVRIVRQAGGVLIADEVQPGFGRVGVPLWGFARLGLVPELVTMGKPMGNGMPVAGVAAQGDVLGAFTDDQPYFNTFGGNPVSMAAAQAVLDALRAEELPRRAEIVGDHLRAGVVDLRRTHASVGTVRGIGQYTGVDVLDPDTGRPSGDLALAVVEAMRERGVLLSVAGPLAHVLKIRPPLVLGLAEADEAVEALDGALLDATAALRRARGTDGGR